MQDPDGAQDIASQTQNLLKARLACAVLREEKILGRAPQVVLRLAERLLGSLALR